MCEVSVESSSLVVISPSPRGSAPRCGVASTYVPWAAGSEELESLRAKQQLFLAQAWVRDSEVQPVPASEAGAANNVQCSHDVTTCIQAIHSNPHPNDARSPAFPTSNAKPVFRTKGIECLIEFILYFTIGSLESPPCPVPS